MNNITIIHYKDIKRIESEDGISIKIIPYEKGLSLWHREKMCLRQKSFKNYRSKLYLVFLKRSDKRMYDLIMGIRKMQEAFLQLQKCSGPENKKLFKGFPFNQ